MDPIRIVAILIALGLVIFVHELGHFMVARWAGVLVERFSIGFGPVLFSFRRGDTEYAISAIPLGGYVKMLGQTDTPGIDEPIDDARSYQNKSVGWRMAIISAGVTMNLIFGFVCYAVAYGIGVPSIPALIGAAVPGMPAWEAGIHSGDNIISVNGHSPADYEMLVNEVALTNPKYETVHLVVERDGKKLYFDVRPKQSDLKPQIGVTESQGLILSESMPVRDHSPAARIKGDAPIAGDEVIAVNGTKVGTYLEYAEAMFAGEGEPATLTLERKGAEGSKSTSTVDVALETNHIRRLGLEMTPGKIVAIQADSPATRAVDEEGNPAQIIPGADTIQAVDGVSDFDPMRLADIIAAKAGQEVTLTLLREDKRQRTVNVKVTPDDTPTWIDRNAGRIWFDGDAPMGIPSLGIAFQVSPRIRRVTPGSPAQRATIVDPSGKSGASLQPGDVVKKIEFIYEVEGKPQKPYEIDVKDEEWPTVFWALQSPEVRKVKLWVKHESAEQGASDAPETATELVEVSLEPEADPTWPFWQRGMNFQVAEEVRQEESIGGALWAGLERTRTSVVRLYLLLRGLIQGTISYQNLAGPIFIGTVAYSLAYDFSKLVLFLGMLNINLAIINFLPIPILDGGHMVFLLYELVLRRQPSERILLIANYMGLFLIIGLMILVFGLDISRLF
ncbi:Putative zinc metalloprotease [Planctomycetes bacterium Pan216]|uniref:Zinc metalloprotease n=1 Tax=Kolteria novifilia TaxID=2527975 RepID=A0A518BCF1_9BACT|nr:Putative zinc metalloprotease [Planctomycetes bacterium Pan216]